MKLLKFDFKNYHSLLKKNPQTSSKLLSSPHFALSKKTNCRNFELNYFLSLSYTHESPCNDTKSNHLAWIIMIASAVTGETKDHHHIFYFLKHNEQFCKHTAADIKKYYAFSALTEAIASPTLDSKNNLWNC